MIVKNFMRVSISIAVFMIVGCTQNSHIPAAYLMHGEVMPELSAPEAGKAQVVFARNQFMGYGVGCGLFEVTTGKPEFLGVLHNERKIVIQAKPGKHIYMVTSEDADFILAPDLEAGKTYYSLVSARNGNFAFGFTPYPVRTDSSYKYNIRAKGFDVWFKDTHLATNSDMSQQWFNENEVFINSLYKKWWPVWEEKSDQHKQELTFTSEDGVSLVDLNGTSSIERGLEE